MVTESVRKCSHCGQYGHNSRTCGGGEVGLKLFGVTINVGCREDESIRKSKSIGSLAAYKGEQSGVAAGYFSNNLVRSKAVCVRKKGVPWSEDEHRSFLAGLEKLGKGDWRGISKKFVPSRTPTQVASHAQKYFMRLSANENKKRRYSLFDMSLHERASPSTPSLEEADKASQIAKQSNKLADLELNIGESKGQTNDIPPVGPLRSIYHLPVQHVVTYHQPMPIIPMTGLAGKRQNVPGEKSFARLPPLVPAKKFQHQRYLFMP
ncbi:hypothetical protein NMG60_11012147 [Bertholletia excelsa]